MKLDIRNRKDIEVLVEKFYCSLLDDELLGVFFTKVVDLDLKEHLPIITNFWSNILFHDMSYKRNVMLKHIDIHKIKRLEKKHFHRWIELWKQSIDLSHEGKLAEEAKKRADLMMQLMMIKVQQSETKGFIQ
ncbi:MAG: group III truncated hemoglobin [Saprospiraceae bacterium]